MAASPSLYDRLPGGAAWLFSLRTFVAAMVALYIGFAFGQERPYWAMASVYIASQPLSGATRSKALYRFLGTLIGAAGAVLIVPNLVSAPALLVLGMAAWSVACLYLALLDRTPRSYVFMLSGYTAAIIGFPSLADPATIFTTAVARLQEIGIGIGCASISASVLFPRRVQPAIAARLERWMDSAARWSQDVLTGREPDATRRRERQALAGDVAEIDLLTSYLAWDPTSQPDAIRTLRALRRRMLMLLPEISAMADRITGLREAEALAPARALMRDASAYIAERGQDRAPAELRAQFDTALGRDPQWADLLRVSLIDRLHATVDLIEDCRRLHRHLREGGPFPSVLAYDRTQGAALVRHQDRTRAFWSAIAAGLAIVLICAFWFATAWTDGATAATLATVVCCFFASQDDPVPAILNFLTWTVVAIVVDTIYLFVLLPPLSSFPMLVMALAPAFLIYGALAGEPRTATVGLPLAAIGSTLLALQPTYNAAFAPFVNSAVATAIGMGAAAIITAVTRSVGAEWSARRLVRQGWAELADAASHSGEGDRARFAGLMLDRIGLLAPRLALLSPENGLGAVDMLAELRAGLNIVMLRKVRRGLPGDVRAAVEASLDAISRHFRERASGGKGLAPGDMRSAIDEALSRAAACESNRAMLALVGLRRALLPDAAPFAPTAAERAG